MTVSIDATAGSEALKVGGVEAVPFDVNGLKIGAFNDGVITPDKLSQPLTAGTAVATTSGTAIDFTGIPSWVKKITVMFEGVSTSSSSVPVIQLGDSGGVEATGYISKGSNISSAAATASFTTGFGIVSAHGSTNFLSGAITFSHLDSNLWVASGSLTVDSSNQQSLISGRKTLSSTLDRIRLTTVNGTDTFDAGSINILYE